MPKVVKVEPIPVSYPEPNDFNAIRHLCLVKITTDDGVAQTAHGARRVNETFTTSRIKKRRRLPRRARAGGRRRGRKERPETASRPKTSELWAEPGAADVTTNVKPRLGDDGARAGS